MAAVPHIDVALQKQVELATERPYDAAVQNDLGNLLLVDGQEDAAEAAYRRSLELDGSHEGARFNLGLLLQQKGEHQEALEQFAVVLELEPTHAWAHYQIGVSLQELDRRDDALEHYSRAFGLDPTLSFAENNPHIIDNTMVTEALLLSSRYAASTSRTVARQYDDPDRIAQLMLDQAKADEEAAAAAAGKPVAKSQAEKEMPQPVQRAMPVNGEHLGARLDSTPMDAPEGTGEDTGESGEATTVDNLGGGIQVGAPRTDRHGRDRNAAARAEAAERARSRSGDTRETDSGTSRAPATDLGGQRYRPSRRSSASLDLKLLPEEEIG